MIEKSDSMQPNRYIESISEENNDFFLKDAANSILRRKKLVIFSSSLLFFLNSGYYIKQRIFNPIYEGSFNLLIKDPVNTSTQSQTESLLANSSFASIARNDASNDVPTLIQVLKSPVLLEPLAKKYSINSSFLADKIKVRPTKVEGIRRNNNPGVLKVTYQDSNPKRGKVLLNDLSNLYLASAQEQRQKKLSEGLDFISLQEPKLIKKNEEAKSLMEQFRKKYNIIEPIEFATQTKSNLIEYEKTIISLNSNIKNLKKLKNKIITKDLIISNFEESISQSVNEEDIVSGLKVIDFNENLLNELKRTESELAFAKTKFVPESSKIKNLENKREKLKPLLISNQLKVIDNAIFLNNETLDVREQQLELLRKKFKELPSIVREYESINQNLKIIEENLLSLLATKENFQLQIAQRTVPWQIIKNPVFSPNPIEPDLREELINGLILCLGAGALIGYVRDRLDYVFRTPNEVKEAFKKPLLGNLPYLSSFKELREEKEDIFSVLNKFEGDKPDKEKLSERFIYQESLRNIYTSIKFLDSKSKLKIISITSSQPAEGKSLIVCLLAKAISELGLKVLLIDGDMRKPQIHVRLGINNLRGLSNLLTEDKSDWKKFTVEIEGHKNWKVITAGTKPPDPSRLLNSPILTELISKIKDSDEFDLVIFDTPPIIGMSDSSLIARNVDGQILIVGLGNVNKKLPGESINKIYENNNNLLGIITNSITKVSAKTGKDGYGNGYSPYEAYNDDLNNSSDQEQSDIEKKPTLLKDLTGKIKILSTKLLDWLDN